MNVNERDIETVVDNQLSRLGWIDSPESDERNVWKQQAKTNDQNDLLKRRRPDYVLYRSGTDQIIGIIEVRKPSAKKENIEAALKQGIEYAKFLECPIVFATDGYYLKSHFVSYSESLQTDGMEIETLLTPEGLLEYIEKDNARLVSSGDVIRSKDDLVNRFKKAENVLKADSAGLGKGMDRFSEFANLIFLKLKLEESDKEEWNTLCSLTGEKLDEEVKRNLKKYEGLGIFSSVRIRDHHSLERLIAILKSINLSFTETDIKGDAFEYFIHSYTRGARNDLGQYFTPRHIVKLMVQLLAPRVGETIYDPFCGTGGMLIECFRRMCLSISKDDHEREKKMHRLKNETLYGRDKDAVHRIAKMNMILFGDGHSNIEQGDSFAHVGGHKYDIVITNFPFSQQTDEYHKYDIKKKGKGNGDSIAIQHCLGALKDTKHARACIIVPIGVLYKDELKQEREYIHKNFQLERVIELSPYVFQPYTLQQTAVLLIRRHKNKAKHFMYSKVSNDGYSQNAYRIRIPGRNDIQRVIDGEQEEKVFFESKMIEEGCKFKKLNFSINTSDSYKLSDVAHVFSGSSLSPNKTPNLFTQNNKDHPFYMMEELSQGHISYALQEARQYVLPHIRREKALKIVPPGTVLIGTSGQGSLKNHRALLEREACFSSTLTAITLKENSPITSHTLFAFFILYDLKNLAYDEGYPGFRKSIIEQIEIPKESKKVLKLERLIPQFREIEIEKSKMIRSMGDSFIRWHLWACR